ncbi:hypothetical protein CSC17_4094 [Klebsiella oxytoca]|nr:hypothetical protein CSC17_4094 [Klebsiella oxytoca]
MRPRECPAKASFSLPDSVIAHAFRLHCRQRFCYLARDSGINKNKQK